MKEEFPPEIGEECGIDYLMKFCAFYDEWELFEILKLDPPEKPFIFDGCSGPVKTVLRDGTDLSAECFLHDVGYYCGYSDLPSSEASRARYDYKFGVRLAESGAPIEVVDKYVLGVRVAGDKWPGAKWGYGRETSFFEKLCSKR